MQNLTTIAKWAESIGISRQQGYEAIKRCGIPITDGQVDIAYATHLYQQKTRSRVNVKREPNAGSQAAPGDGSSAGAAQAYQDSRARREAAEASIAEMKQAEMEGLYLLKAEVDAAVFEAARMLRDGMTNCARRIAGEAVGASTAEECEAIIDREHRALLESLAQALQEKLSVGEHEVLGAC